MLTVVPGNHDIFTPGSRRKKRFESWFGHLLGSDLPEYQVEGPWPNVRLVGEEVAIVGMCSARVPPVPGIAAGRLGDEQLSALLKICAHRKVVGRTIYVVVHHAPLRPDGKVDRRDHGLADAVRLIQACTIGKVAAVLCGHIHSRFSLQVPGGPRIICGGSSTWLGHEGYWLLDSRGGRLAQAESRALYAPEAVEVAVPGGLIAAG